MDTPGGFVELEQLDESKGRQVGEVYVAFNTRDKKIYAIRKIDVKKYDISDWQMKEFSRVMQLENQFLVQTVFVFFKDGALHHVMEMLQDRTLANIIPQINKREDYIPEDKMWQYLRQIAQALSVLQGVGVPHLNLWPANVFINRNGDLIVGDFGLAYFWIVEYVEKHGEKTSMPYTSPEIIADEPFGPSADIYSLGVIAYELCTGKKPFEYELDVEFDKYKGDDKSKDKEKDKGHVSKKNLQKNRREWFLKAIRSPESRAKISAQFDASPSVIEMKYSKGLKDLILSMLDNGIKERPTADIILGKTLPLNLKKSKHGDKTSKEEKKKSDGSEDPQTYGTLNAFAKGQTLKADQQADSYFSGSTKKQDKDKLKEKEKESTEFTLSYKGKSKGDPLKGKDSDDNEMKQDTIKRITKEQREELVMGKRPSFSQYAESDKKMSEVDFSNYFAVYDPNSKYNASEETKNFIRSKFLLTVPEQKQQQTSAHHHKRAQTQPDEQQKLSIFKQLTSKKSFMTGVNSLISMITPQAIPPSQQSQTLKEGETQKGIFGRSTQFVSSIIPTVASMPLFQSKDKDKHKEDKSKKSSSSSSSTTSSSSSSSTSALKSSSLSQSNSDQAQESENASNKTKLLKRQSTVKILVNQKSNEEQIEMDKRWAGYASLMAQPFEYTHKYKQFLQYLDSIGCINLERVGDKTNYPQVLLRNVVGIFFAVKRDDELIKDGQEIPSFNVNNALLVAKLYIRRGYRVVYHFNPTPREFYKWSDWLLDQVQEDLTIYFSGGGSQLADKTGREADGKAEAMVMYDEATKMTEKGLDPVV
ncbi:MAG: hypothetical protein EZS28_021491, partial [Streblomastix strix]